ncbi:MAG: glycosyltransferase family 9 protein [Desulfamplus sp.]|nr:glycosyltransferase family 9 protein [Desulfamplus sp.]
MLKLIKKILIIKPSAFGDIIHTLPFLNALKAGYPDAQIDWVVAHGLHTFLEGHPMINRLWVIRKDQWKKLKHFKKTLSDIVTLTRQLRQENYDVAVDLSGILRSGLITFASGARLKLGFEESDEGSSFFYSHKIRGDMNIHAIDRYLELARALGCQTDIVAYPFSPLNENPEILKELPENYIVISPSAGKSANQWHAPRFGELASMLSLPSVIISSPSDASIAQEVVKHSGGNAVSIAGRTNLKDLIPVIRKASYFITNDTGPMHVAAALNVPVFVIFGPANPVRTGPYNAAGSTMKSAMKTGIYNPDPAIRDSGIKDGGFHNINPYLTVIDNGIHTIIQNRFDCTPCYAQKPCGHWKCMNDLTVQDVFSVIRSKDMVLKTVEIEES